MWRVYWQDIDERIQTEILSVILRETRHYHRILWRRCGSKFADAYCGLRWTVIMKLEEFSEIPPIVARRGRQAVLLCCDRQKSRVPSSVLLNDLLTVVLQQLPLVQVGISTSGENERFEDEVAKLLEHSRDMADVTVLAGAFLQHLRGR